MTEYFYFRRRGGIKFICIPIALMMIVMMILMIVTTMNWLTFSSNQEVDDIAIYKTPEEIHPSKIEVGEVISHGNYQGRYCATGSHDCYKVTIKSDLAQRNGEGEQGFLDEASVMAQLNHPNVVRLVGVVTKSPRPMLIVEYMSNGTLRDFLERSREYELKPLTTVKILRDIARGMAYLAEMGYVHRDLDIRNIFIDEQSVCKVSGFEISQKLEKKNDGTAIFTPTQEERRFPLLGDSVAPEAMTKGEYTSASDVWSYGFVIWEMLSYGKMEFNSLSVIGSLADAMLGYHQLKLEKLNTAHPVLTNLIRRCWNMDRKLRPTFHEIASELDEILQNLEWIKERFRYNI